MFLPFALFLQGKEHRGARPLVGRGVRLLAERFSFEFGFGLRLKFELKQKFGFGLEPMWFLVVAQQHLA